MNIVGQYHHNTVRYTSRTERCINTGGRGREGIKEKRGINKEGKKKVGGKKKGERHE